METILNAREIFKLAPGASPRKNAANERLLDTAAWLQAVAAGDFRPVFAMQGSAHSDSERDPKEGRHLVVAARPDGVAVALLNSHDRLMRVWEGVGLWHAGELILCGQWALQRWKVEYSLWEPKAPPEAMQKAQELLRRKLQEEALVELAQKVAKDGYIAGRGRPAWKALHESALGGGPHVRMPSLYDHAFALVAAAREGNLEPSTAKSTRRNVKGIRRPDAYWHLALATYKAAIGIAEK